ncbi:MAG TPA: alpha/beta hydrolase [Acidimicrobiia bacterium]|nr:alpha/beta hydrolase [Acidimicrobiia bacterium]
MRARHPDVEGHVERDGVRLGFEVFGEGDRTILLLPTWTIVHSRFWKMQVPYLARHFRVVTYDGPGNGRSDRVTDPARYTADAYALDAGAVLQACGVKSAIVVGLSLGAAYGVRLATLRPELVSALVMIGPSIPLTPASPEREQTLQRFLQPPPEKPKGWHKYNLAYWHSNYPDFVEYFFSQCFSERHSTKAIEDAVGWGAETGPEILEAEALKSSPADPWPEIVGQLDCPTLVIHGTADRISPYARGVEAARLSGGTLLRMEASGHIPNVRDPVKVNLALRDFIERVA